MIRAKGGEVTFSGIKSHVMAEAVTVLRALKKELSEEEYKMVIRFADKSEEQVKDEAERAREMLKKLLGL
jgi:hemerythrin-like domain-containing protein